ncbi:hypothetical protein XAC29_22744 (plasmid) [Xanthomonas axonopodis Xac29-1]|nr:hypothetical protein XAC29_22744 [Xanthomonas axonopodis Xac29-1]
MALRAVSGPHTLDGGDARACQARSVGDGLPTTAQSDDASMYGLIGGAATVLVSGLRQLNTLTLTLAAVFGVRGAMEQGSQLSRYQ